MGRCTAEKLKDNGSLILCDLNKDALDDLANELGNNTRICVGDLTNEDVLNELSNLIKELGNLKGLIHFAGVSETFGDARKIMEINLVGTAKLIEHLSPLISEGTVIINTSSMTAYTTLANEEMLSLLSNPLDNNFLNNIESLINGDLNLAYGLSKKGVMLLSKNQASELGKKGARIISISPGAIKTPMVEREMSRNKDAINKLISITPMKRIGTTEDIANLVEFLLDDRASFITGTDILIDGGVTVYFPK